MSSSVRWWDLSLFVLGSVLGAVALTRILIEQALDIWTYTLFGVGLLCLVVLGVLHLRAHNALGSILRRGIVLILLLTLLGLVNFAAGRFFFRLDLTELRGYSLAQETFDALADLHEPVRVTAFLRPTDYRHQVAEKLLGEYAAHSPWITYEIIDPDLHPSVMQRKGIERYGSLLFESATRRQEINSVDEQSITSAILRLSDDRPRVLYFSSGYGERDLSSPRREGFSIIEWYLRNKGYEAKTLNLAQDTEVPPDMGALIIASPRHVYSEQDQAWLDDYLRQGGRILALLDAGLPHPFPRLLEEWGVQVGENLVFDPLSSFFGDAATPLVNDFPPSSLTRPLQGTNVFFPVVREVAPADEVPEGLQVTSLIQTSPKSWAEMNLEEPQASFDPDEDKLGPISLAVSVRATLAAGRGADAARARLVVFGDSDFVSNGALSSTDVNLGNAALLLNAVNWLLESEDLVNLQPIDTQVRRLILTAREMRWVGYISILLVPLFAALIGGIIWWRRHR